MKRIVPLLATLCLMQGAHSQTTAVPGFISYQGRALNSAGTVMGAGTPVNRTVTFRIWDHASNSLTGNLLYSEQQVVTIAEGEFSVLVGAGAVTAGAPLGYSESAKGTPTVKINDPSVFAGANRFLGVTIDDGTIAVDNEVSPRQQIVTSAYALRARYAEQLGSNGGTALTALDSGNVGIGNTNPPSRFTVTAAGTGTSTPQLLVTADDITERLRLGVDSTGNGTGFIQSFKEGAGAQNLLLNPNGGNVGIGGTGTPAVALSVTGAITATGAITGGSFGTAGNLNVAGNVGIGTSAPGGAKLEIADGVGNPIKYGSLQITRPGTASPGAHLAFVRNGNHSMGMGYAGETNIFGMGDTTTGSTAFSPNFLAINPANGKVGIGTTVPSNYLSVEGGGQVATASTSTAVAHFGGADVHTYFGSYDGASAFATWMQTMRPSDQMVFNMAINPNGGNVGIGTKTPAAKLDINGAAHVRGNMNVDGLTVMGDAILGKNVSGGLEYAFWPRDGNGTYINYGVNGFYIRTNASATVMTMTNSGVVQIGTATAIGRLNVGAQASALVNSYGYFNGSGAGGLDRLSHPQTVSIYADGTILSPEFNISSDLRIKTDLHASEPVKDLKTLMGIEVTDYHYKDKPARGNGSHKKVIAQQVEKVYPQAVNITLGVVPDIYKKAGVKDGWIKLATDLKKGDRVRLISEKEEGVHEVLEVKADRFLTEFKPAGDQVFVYGREVNDFRSVDYDAIAMLNVSATQELARQLETVQAENAALRREQETVQAENAALRRELATKEQSMEARLIALERRMSGEGVAKTVSLKTARAAK